MRSAQRGDGGLQGGIRPINDGAEVLYHASLVADVDAGPRREVSGVDVGHKDMLRSSRKQVLDSLRDAVDKRRDEDVLPRHTQCVYVAQCEPTDPAHCRDVLAVIAAEEDGIWS